MSITDYEQIVTNLSSPTLVLAGPGAGKTYLLADRLKYLLGRGVDKNTITVLALRYCQMLWMRFFSGHQRRRFTGCLDIFIPCRGGKGTGLDNLYRPKEMGGRKWAKTSFGCLYRRYERRISLTWEAASKGDASRSMI